MRADFEKIRNKPTDSFLVKMVKVEKRVNLKNSYHYHPEFELIWTQKSSGKRFIGNNIANYEPGELIFLGKNIPHCWMTKEPSVQMVVQMKEDFLGKDFINAPECYPLRLMFEESYRGVHFFGKTKKQIQKKMKRLSVEKSFNRLLLLLDILNELALSSEFEYLSTEGYPTIGNRKDFERIHILYNYIHEKFQEDISLDEAAKHLNLTKSSFCNFVKRKTKKTFSQIVIEARLAKATELLIESNKTINQVCYESGFNDPSYFFRQFSKAMGSSPKIFRDSYN